ncbi:2-Methylisocitrate lyase, PEP mutase family [Leifsonia sp. 98AMF]|uniref:isocitrate lyase/PEP mutase family protein n=1 Tax=unclassified Leifsonia TaxID=2663824 RepID=UPI00087B09DA|nr:MULTISPECIES: isocitrate lyase/phosphoenolpyruvate mutase family protein [unclassified Leifsonia]SDH01839.1 2-Methylisocitrate lyase, PEP mutase family [Leifsonia sp. 197AMF]SDJ39551.1 2-Methylisocitrate lyase, PEP mutase family [Leifsonia sp. 466MF]SDK38813.1 2-Methylisocitrate lyase, PEP mutase family [Leifsonia sp. 157MF]SDN59895.1 2-Methylisocitrate lyase, PEP mutase family [Leifsonia sp. 509MF]SEN49418.1 2-Methylisocitrate lyase, PEP mutase family [Leifsonia sp. 467MF]
MTDIQARGAELRRLHDAPELLQVVNVWDAISARVIADLPDTRALATASHSIAATLGYEDGEKIPLDLMLDMVGRIVAATDLPVSADLEGGYGDSGETIRRAIGVGAVGANLEDQLRPFDDAVASVRAAIRAADSEGVPFALNARTDVFLRDTFPTDHEKVEEAIRRGRAFLDEGATCVFVPGKLDERTVEQLVGGLGARKLSVIAVPGSVAPTRLEELGVARVSYGPWTQRVALTALKNTALELYAGGALPRGTEQLN